MTNPLLILLLFFIGVYCQKNESPHLPLTQDELSMSKHRHAVEHLEPDPAKSIFNGMAGRNPLQRTTTISSRVTNKKHAGAVNSSNRRGRRNAVVSKKEENLDKEYDLLVEDFNEDQELEKIEKVEKTENYGVDKMTSSTFEPTTIKWSTRVIGSAEVQNPRAIEAPILEHRIHVPSHLVERVRESEEEMGETTSTTQQPETQRALNLFVPVTNTNMPKINTTSTPSSTTSVFKNAVEIMSISIDDSSGQEPTELENVVSDTTPTSEISSDLRSILTTQLSKLFIAPDSALKTKQAKTIIPNKMKDPLKKSTLHIFQEPTTSVEKNKKSEGSTTQIKPSTTVKLTSVPTKSTTKTTIASTTASKLPEEVTKMFVEKLTKSIKLASSDFSENDQFVEEHVQEERNEITTNSHRSTSEFPSNPNERMLDGTVVKRRKVLTNLAQNHLHRASGLSRRRRETTNFGIQPKTTVSTQERDASENSLSRTKITTLNLATKKAKSTSTVQPSTTSVKNGELRDIALNQRISDQKQGLVKEKSQGSDDKTLDFEDNDEFQEITQPTTKQPQAPSTIQPQRTMAPPQIQQNWVPQPQTGFVQPILNHFIVGNRRFIVPSIPYEQHIAQQNQQFWQSPPQQFIPQNIPQQPFIPQQQFIPQNIPQTVPQLSTTQRPVLPSTVEPPLVRTTQNILPDIIHTSTIEPKKHIKYTDFDLYDETNPSNNH